MSKHYFKKELLNNILRYSNGDQVPLEACANNCGVIVLDGEVTADIPRINDLVSMVGSKGVSRISEAQYEEIKKKLPSKMQPGRSQEPRLFTPEENNRWKAVEAAEPVRNVPVLGNVRLAVEESSAASVAAPATIKQPFKPRSGRGKQK